MAGCCGRRVKLAAKATIPKSPDPQNLAESQEEQEASEQQPEPEETETTVLGGTKTP